MKEMSFIYDREADSLFLFREDRVEDSSIGMGEIIIGFDKGLNLASLEILNPDKLYKIPKSHLSKLRKARMQASCRGSVLWIHLELEMEQESKEIPISIPLERPLACR